MSFRIWYKSNRKNSFLKVNTHFQKRWFALCGNLLYYYIDHTSKSALGLIVLEGCSIGQFMLILIFIKS